MSKSKVPEMPEEVAAAFSAFPHDARKKLEVVRALIFDVAETINGASPLTETLKWGEPAYLTAKKIGSTVRLGWKANNPDQIAIYFICSTNLIDRFRSQFADELTFEGDRAIILSIGETLPVDALNVCLAAALNYHGNK